MPLHDAEEHFGLGIVTTELSLVLSTIPGALCLIEDDRVIRWLSRIVFHVISREYVDILDKGFCSRSRIRGAIAFFSGFLYEQMLQDFHKRTIATHEVDCVPLVFLRMRQAQPDESFP
jgi:hypothetical protein